MPYDQAELKAYYDVLPEDGGFDSLCKMNVPAELPGQRVLDIGCRRGKGVFKLSAAVGERGTALGVDWRAAFVERARAEVPRALEKSGLARSNIEFVVAYPETLAEAGVGEESADAVFVNGVLNLFFDPAQALDQVCRVLKPGGRLICQTVLASQPRDAGVMAAARALGNVVQSAPDRRLFASWLAQAGFDAENLTVSEVRPVAVTAAVDEETQAAVVPSDERVSFMSVTVEAVKPGARV